MADGKGANPDKGNGSTEVSGERFHQFDAAFQKQVHERTSVKRITVMEPIMQGFLEKQQQQRNCDKNQLPRRKSAGHGNLDADGQNPPVEKNPQQAEFIEVPAKYL